MEDISESENSSKEGNAWGIIYQKEKTLWETKILKYFSYNKETCSLCLKGEFILKEDKGENILNPFYLRCNNKNCRKKIIKSLHFLKFT